MDERDTVECPPLMAAGEIVVRKRTVRMRRAITALVRPRRVHAWWLALAVVAFVLALALTLGT
jgi:hypothetical protein